MATRTKSGPLPAYNVAANGHNHHNHSSSAGVVDERIPAPSSANGGGAAGWNVRRAVARRYRAQSPSATKAISSVPQPPPSSRGQRVKSSSSTSPSSASSSRRYRPPTLLLRPGLFLCAIVLMYMVVVVVVTQRHATAQESRRKEHDAGGNNLIPFSKHQNDLKKQAEEIKNHISKPVTGEVDPYNLFPASEADIAAAAPLPIDIDTADHPSPNSILTAFVEQVDYDEWFVTQPLPNRTTASADQLKPLQYSRVHSCRRMLQQWPVDPPDCVVDSDPYLPWIHDVVPSADGRHVHIVAQNRRRCDTGKHDGDTIAFRAGQAALFQHVPLRRVSIENGDTAASSSSSSEPRFVITPNHDDADPDAVATRFLCRWKATGDVVPAVFHFDYDWITHRKRYKGTFREEDGGIKSIHTSQLIFACPVPTASLQEQIRKGTHVQDDWTNLFLDVIPIRTPPRYGKGNQYMQPRYRSEQLTETDEQWFDAVKAYGNGTHLLPLIDDSGRWENLPVCLPSLLQYEQTPDEDPDAAISKPDSDPINVSPLEVHPQYPRPVKKHRIVSCLWASAGYHTRGERFAINDGQRRLLEWLTYHQQVLGFDHTYLYDNTGAFTNDTSLKPIADLFPDTVTYIGWPSKVCNNRPNNVDSPGERSSQYAAESSCRLRFGPHTDWIGQFDIDEYLVPMGSYHKIHELLDTWEKEDTRIVSFDSWRAWPRWSQIDTIVPIRDKHLCWDRFQACFELTVPLNHTILQTYNCDRQKPGQKKSRMPAEKQIYRADYVTMHFMHYSAVTTLSEQNASEWQAQGLRYRPRPFPDPRQRFGDEKEEALMIHTKAVARQDTAGWQKVCHVTNLERPPKMRGLCRLGVPWPEPWPEDPETAPVKGNADGWAYNCFINNKAEQELVPKLQKALEAKAPILGKQTFN